MEVSQKLPAAPPPPPPAAGDEVFVAPASFAQSRLWFLDRLRPGSPAYNLFTAVRPGGLRPEVFQRALDALVERHESLRTTFTVLREEPIQVIAPSQRVALPQVDLRALPPAARETELVRLAAAEALRAFDLARGPLLRVTLVRLGEGDDAVLFNLHHIVGDGWSMGVLVREVTALYEAFSRGLPSPLPDPTLQYADFAQAQRDWLQGDVLEEQIAWWRRQLAGAEPLELPADRPRPAVRSARGRIRAELLPAGLSRSLAELARRRGTSLFVVLLAGLDSLLYRYTGSEDVSIGTVVAGRDDVDTEGMIGFFVNTLVLRTDLSGRPSFLELLARAHTAAMDAFGHQDVPFEKLAEELAPRRDLSRTPFFDGVLSLQNTPGETPHAGDTGGAPGLSAPTAAKFDWSLNVIEVREGLLLSFEYSTELFDGTTIQRLLAHLRNLLAGAAADPDLPVPALPMLAEAERHQLAGEWNDSWMEEPAVLSVPALFEAQAARDPEAPAVLFAGERLPYGALDRRAGRLAHRLRGLGVGPEARVGLFLERSADLLVGILGVWKAGGAWVPLDPAQPDARLALVAEDAFRGLANPVLVVHARLHDRLPALPLDGVEVVLLEDQEGEAVVSRTAPGDLAYVIYTSGTTGRPKGVMVEHGSLARLAHVLSRLFDYRPGDRMPCPAPFTFDAFLLDVVPPLVSGATASIFDPRPPLDLPGLLDEVEAATHLDTVPALMRQVVEGLWQRAAVCPRIRSVIIGGDASPTDVLAAMAEVFPAARPTVVYGPTETTILGGYHRFGSSPYEEGRNLLGRPLPGYTLDLRDRDGGLVPVGVPGEVWIGGPYVARGYLHQPELTAERFVVLDGSESRRFYRTGDLARRLPDGCLEFLGRIDHQVKVRGFRIELGEVEAVLAAEPEVRDVAVLARQAPGDTELRLAAWVVPRGAADGGLTSALRDRLRARLPEYMVPVDWALLPELPLTPNGKLDRRALLESLAADGGAVRDVPYEAPATPTGELLAGLWAELLGRERIGARDHFFDLGGHSLLATRLAARLGALFGIEVPLNTVFEAPTLAAFAARVDKALAAGQGLQAPPIVRVPRTGRLPLSFAQERLWFLDQLEPGRPVYNMPVALRLGDVDPALLARSLGEVARRHEALRTTFPAVQGLPYQEIAPPGDVALPVVDLHGLPAGRRLDEARRQLAEEAVRPFDLVRGPLLRALALRLDDGDLALALTLHHVVSDGWSMEVLTAELTALYQAFVEGLPSPLPALPVQYADYAVWQRGWLSGEVLARQVEYWKRRLAGAPTVLELPADRPRPPVQSFRGANWPLAFPPELTAALHDVGRRHGTTLFMTLLAVFQALLHRASSQDVVLVGSPVANRHRPEVEGLIGFFANTLVLAGDLGDDPPFAGLLARVRDTVLAAQAHQDLPFEKLVEELDPERSLSHSPLFQVLLTLTQSHRRPPAAALSAETAPTEMETAPGPAKFDLSLALEERDGRLAGSLEYAVDLFDAPTVARLGEQLLAALAAVTAEPAVRPSELPLLSAAQRQQLLLEWGPAADLPSDPRRLHDLIAEQAARTPEAVAVRFRDEALTYADLDAQSNRLAHLLLGAGAGPEVPVAVFMDRSVEMVVALLGVLKAGAAYVPLDPAYPQDRLAFMLKDCGAPVLLSQDWLVDRLPAETGARRICLDPTFETVEDESDEPPVSPAGAVTPGNLAYVIYTSGSIGRPKGVAVTHASAVALLRWAAGVFPDEELAGVLASTSICFDLSVFELFFPLSRGGCVLVVENALELLALADGGVGGQPVTLLNTVPSAAAELVRALGLPASVRTVCLAGEPIPAPLVGQVYAQPGVGRLLNLYGPSEDTTYSTVQRVDPSSAASPPIGRPVAGTRAYVLDAGLAPVPPGMPGELYLGGAGLARGYFRRPELTAGRFVPDPFGSGQRLYRTGDRVRHLSDGRLDYLGRFDHQVKLRGFRVELGEIETVLARHPAVRQAVAVVRGSSLVAYVVPADEPQIHEIREYLRDRLPDYMVPAVFVVLPELPLNPSGKIDRRALPDPGTETRMPPRDLVELELARLWEEVLDVRPVGVRDDFFDLGGHSLLAVRLMALIRDRFGRELPLTSLFRAATIEQLATLLRQGETLEQRMLVEITPPGSGSLPPFFNVHPAGGNILCYVELARALGPDQPFYGLQLLEETAGSVEEMAARYVAAVREVQPQGPYALGGWSSGGTIAFEMARLLAGIGEEVRLLALIDTPRPRLDGAWNADEPEMMVMFARDLAATYGRELPGTVTAEYLRGIDPEERIQRVLAEAQAIHLFPPDLTRPDAERLFGMFRSVQEAVGVYEPQPYPGRAVVFLADGSGQEDPAFGWGGLAEVEAERIAGDHYSIVRAPHVEELARRLRGRLAGGEGR